MLDLCKSTNLLLLLPTFVRLNSVSSLPSMNSVLHGANIFIKIFVNLPIFQFSHFCKRNNNTRVHGLSRLPSINSVLHGANIAQNAVKLFRSPPLIRALFIRFHLAVLFQFYCLQFSFTFTYIASSFNLTFPIFQSSRDPKVQTGILDTYYLYNFFVFIITNLVRHSN